MKNENIIELKNISISFGEQTVLDGFNLYIRDGEFVTLLGPSGCGKTTTLRIIGGFEEPDSGDIQTKGILTQFSKGMLFSRISMFTKTLPLV